MMRFEGMIKVSVALATYNGERYLREQLDSILNQTFQVEEIVIVDDNSTDNTFDLLSNYDFKGINVTIHRNETNLGVVQSFKRAICDATGDFIAICDQDDVWFPEKISEQVERALSVNELCMPLVVLSDLDLIDEDGGAMGKTFWSVHSMTPNLTTFKRALVFNDAVGCSMLINRKMADYLMSMPNGVMMHDHWIYLISKSLGKCLVIDRPLLWYRVHNNSVTSKKKLLIAVRIYRFIKNFFSSSYLKQNILQANLFFNCFYKDLDCRSIESIKALMRLENKSFFFKWVSIRFRD